MPLDVKELALTDDDLVVTAAKPNTRLLYRLRLFLRPVVDPKMTQLEYLQVCVCACVRVCVRVCACVRVFRLIHSHHAVRYVHCPAGHWSRIATLVTYCDMF